MEKTDSDHPRKRRRREITPNIVPARLDLDERLGGDSALISETLWHTLGLPTTKGVSNRQPCFVAVALSSPLYSGAKDSIWTLTPAYETEIGLAETTSTGTANIKLPVSSSACQSLLKSFAALDDSRPSHHVPKAIDVRVVVAKPLHLETIFVTVEKGLLDKFDDVQSKFGGGFYQNRNKRPGQQDILPNGSPRDQGSPTSRLTQLVRQGLSELRLVHLGDSFALPLPSHPITHVRPAPAVIVECEPVSQGLVSARTNVVVLHSSSSQSKVLQGTAAPAPIVEESLEDTAEDTSNDAFFSAAEDRQPGTASEIEGTTEEDSTTEDSTQEDSGDDSDSMDDMISMSAPGLPPQAAGTLSSMTSATPRPGMFSRTTGTHTPGSVYSSFTTTTAKAGTGPGKVFKTEALLQKVPIAILHPRPAPGEDDEAFVFVDTGTLAKIGCFSGDWVRLEVAHNVNTPGFPSATLNVLGGLRDEEDSDWRPVRIFGVAGLPNQKPRYTVDKTGDRRSSFSQNRSLFPTTPVIYLSPILLLNLVNTKFVKVGVLPRPNRSRMKSIQLMPSANPRGPPLVRELSLLRVVTPLAQDPALQSTLFTSMKMHFEQRQRLLKRGDLIAVAVDEDLARATSSTGASDGTPAEDRLISRLNVKSATNRSRLNVAWFKVQALEAEALSDPSTGVEGEMWGGAAILDTSHARTTAPGTASQLIPATSESWSRYWLGLKTPPRKAGQKPGSILTTADLPTLEKLPIEKRISNLVAASTSMRAIHLGLPPLFVLLHSTQRQVGKTHILHSACASEGVHTFPISSHDLLSENASTSGGGDVKTEALLRVRADRALSCGARQTALLIQHIDVLTADRMASTLQDILPSWRVVFATTNKIDDIPDGVRSLFTHEFEVGAPDEIARESILRNLCLETALPLSPNVNLKNVALQTAALVAGDLSDVVDRAILARSYRLSSLADSQSCSLTDILLSGGQSTTHLLPSDFASAISAARSTFSDAIGAPKIPTVTWSDVGGLANQKDAIMETISLPLTRPELFANGVRKRSGILFYGPPGTGKTLLAKAIATEFSLNFFSVKGPELLNMYIGESEANVRRVFQRARDARPCVVFFDELDSVAPKRGNQGDSGGVMDRIVSQLLAELDGMSGSGGNKDGADGSSTSSGGGVFVIGATNRPDLLDPALLRPGRFDKMLYLGVADSHDAQVTILEALTRKFALAPDVNLRRVAERLPFTYTGADLYALCSDAMLKAITRKTKAVDERVKQISEERGEGVSTGWFFDHAATPEDVEVVVNEADFAHAQRELVGSVSAKELEHFERIRRLFDDLDIGAEEKGRARSESQTRPAATSSSSSATTLPLRSTSTTANTNTDTLLFRDKGKQRQQSSFRPQPQLRSSMNGGNEALYLSGNDDNDYGVSSTSLSSSTSSVVTAIRTNGSGAGTESRGGSSDSQTINGIDTHDGNKGKGKAHISTLDGNGFQTRHGQQDEAGEEEGLYD